MKAIKLIAIFLGMGVILFVSLNFDTLRMALSDDAQMKRQLKDLREQHLRDSTKLLEYQQLIRIQADSIATLRQENAELKGGYSIPPSQETAILDAINKGEKMSAIEKMPGYKSFTQKYSKSYSSFKYAVPWVVDYDILLGKDSDGNFMGDKTKKHDPKIAREIKTLIWASKEKGWTAQSIIECHKVIVILLEKADRNDLPKTKKDSPSRDAAVITAEQEAAILAAINSGDSMSSIEKMPGYNNFINKYSKSYSSFRYAVSWMVNYVSLLEKDSKTGGFKSDKTKKHDPIIARDIKTLILKKKGSGWTARSIIECHKEIIYLLNQAEPIKQ